MSPKIELDCQIIPPAMPVEQQDVELHSTTIYQELPFFFEDEDPHRTPERWWERRQQQRCL